MMGKISLLGTLVFSGILLALLIAVPYSAESAEQQTGTTTMNVTVRGYVSISVSSCITNGIAFTQSDPGDTGVNGTCNWGEGVNGGSGYNLTRDSSSTADINFTHATNRTNLTNGAQVIELANLTYHSNSTEDNGSNLLLNDTATALNESWEGMETCAGISSSSPDCWSTYFLNIPANQAPGDYQTGYCWCGRRTNTAESNCGSCT